MGIKVPRSTLRDWATRQHVQRYREIQTEVIPEIEERLAQKSEGLATQYSDLEADVLVRLKKELPNVPVRDLSRAARDLATGKGISTDKARDLRGRGEPERPNPIQEFEYPTPPTQTSKRGRARQQLSKQVVGFSVRYLCLRVKARSSRAFPSRFS
jgi:hypothetical protein